MSAKSPLDAAVAAEIPPFPQVATELLQLLRNPNADLVRVVQLVEKDVALTASVLKTANSGLYGRSHQIGSVPAAIRILGTSLFSQLVMRTAVKNYLGNSMAQAHLNRCWSHCLACAEISKIVALRADLQPEVAYSAGLLHDIGRFGLAISNPAKYAKLGTGDGYADALEAENKLLGTDHAEVGRLVAAKLGMPDEFAIVAGRHHDRLDDTESGLLAVVNTACGMASALGFSVVTLSQNRSLETVLAHAPASIRAVVDPNPEFWQANLLNIFDS